MEKQLHDAAQNGDEAALTALLDAKIVNIEGANYVSGWVWTLPKDTGYSGGVEPFHTGSPHTRTALPTRPRPSSPLISPPSPSCGGYSAMLCVSAWVHGPDLGGILGPCIVPYEAPRGRRQYRGCENHG